MEPRRPERLKAHPALAQGFVRHELYLLVAILALALALLIPRLLRGEWLQGLGSLLMLAGVLVALLGALLLITWLVAEVDRPGTGWRDRALQAAGQLLRFLLFGFIGLLIATALVANHRLGPGSEALVPLGVGALAGLGGVLLFQRLGKARFWPAFGRFALALLGAFFGGILGILGPEPWAVDAGILVPLGLFLALALLGRIAPPPPGSPAEPPGEPLI